MYAIKENTKVFEDDIEVTTFSRDVIAENRIEAEAGTTGFCAEDGDDQGARTYFRIKGFPCTNMTVRTSKDDSGCSELEVSLVGNSELYTIIKALVFIRKVLMEQTEDEND